MHMYKPSFIPTADSSYCGSKPNNDQIITDLKLRQQLVEQQKVFSEDKETVNNEQNMQKKARRPSFMQLEENNQIKIEKMIRNQIQKHSKLGQKMALQQDETCICTSDIYSKDSQHWKNRQITQLTTKRFDGIPVEKIKKIKLLNEQPMSGYNLFRVTINQKQIKDYAIRAVDTPLWFSNTIWICLASMGNQMNIKKQFDGQISGNIIKKSQFLGNWQLRQVSLSTKSGLISFRNKDTIMTTKVQKTSEIWTRLETVVHQNIKYVIIKTWHMMFKYQFGIPINDVVRWAKAFCVLVK